MHPGTSGEGKRGVNEAPACRNITQMHRKVHSCSKCDHLDRYRRDQAARFAAVGVASLVRDAVQFFIPSLSTSSSVRAYGAEHALMRPLSCRKVCQVRFRSACFSNGKRAPERTDRIL